MVHVPAGIRHALSVDTARVRFDPSGVHRTSMIDQSKLQLSRMHILNELGVTLSET